MGETLQFLTRYTYEYPVFLSLCLSLTQRSLTAAKNSEYGERINNNNNSQVSQPCLVLLYNDWSGRVTNYRSATDTQQ